MKKQKDESIFITFTIILTLIFVAIFLLLLRGEDRLRTLEARYDDIPHKVCINMTYEDKIPIFKQVPCSCASWGCLMWCGNIIGYRIENKTVEVCEPKYE